MHFLIKNAILLGEVIFLVGEEIKYTILPWMDTLTVGKIIPPVIGLLVGYCFVEYLLKKFNYSIRRGSLSLVTNTVWPMLLNICIFSIAYWQWAFPIATVMGLIFLSVLRHELKVAHEDELEGFRGLNKEIRKLRAEAFADLSIEEQMAYKKTVKTHKFYWWIFLPAVVIIPFLIVLLLEQFGLGDYLFQVVYFE